MCKDNIQKTVLFGDRAQEVEILKDLPFNVIGYIARFEDDTLEKSLSYMIHPQRDGFQWVVNVRDKINNTPKLETFDFFGEALEAYNTAKVETEVNLDAKICVAYFRGRNEKWEKETGYLHNCFYVDSLELIIDSILKAKLNVMIEQGVKFKDRGEGIIVWIDSYRFDQR